MAKIQIRVRTQIRTTVRTTVRTVRRYLLTVRGRAISALSKFLLSSAVILRIVCINEFYPIF